MEIKEEIEIILESLKKAGYERGAIEKELEYSVNYIDQVLSKGGNKRFLKAIKKFKNQILQKATSTNNIASVVAEPNIEYQTENGYEGIEIKTASGKTLNILPEGKTEIGLLNAFLEERDRVITTIKDEKQARIDELKQDKEDLMRLLNSGLGDLSRVQQAIFAMVRTLQEHEAVMTSKGNKTREAEMLDVLSKLNGRNYNVDARQDSAVLLRK